MRLILALPVLLAALLPVRLAAQEDPNANPNDAPLGDVARSLRKNSPPSQAVIDDDNLSKVMEQAESRHESGSALRLLMVSGGNRFQVSAPDVTCSLAFTANVKSLLSNQYAQMELPAAEVHKLEGPATIEGDALIVALFNRTDWHVSEVSVALTVVKKNQARGASLSGQSLSYDELLIGTNYGAAKLQPGLDGNLSQEDEVRPEKKSDVTVIYRMRAAAPPSATTVFSALLNMELAPDEEWHWAIVQARGYPPQSYAGNTPRTAAQTNQPVSGQSSSIQPASDQPAPIQPTSLPASAAPQNPPLVSPPQN